MTIQELNVEQNKVRTALAAIDVLAAIELIEKRVSQAGDWQLQTRLESVKTAFNLMLQFFANGAEDSQRDKVMAKTISELYEIDDLCMVRLATPLSYDLFYSRRNQADTATVRQLLDAYMQEQNKISLLESADGNNSVIEEISRKLEAIEVTAFNKIWTTFPLSDDDCSALDEAMRNAKLPSHLKCLILSALLLSITKFYDERKLLLLCDAYQVGHRSDLALAARAIVAIVITLFIYRSRLRWRENIKLKLESLAQLTHWQDDLKSTCVRLSRSRNTENISRRMRDDLLPNIKKMSPEMLKNMNKGKDPELIIADMEENPEWKQWLEESGVEDKLREFNEMQLSGDDVHVSTFAHLKSFPFFNTLANWFMPFHCNHSAVAGKSSQQQSQLARLLEKMPIMCNSDRFSIFLAISTMPARQQELLADQFKQQAGAIEEMNNAEMLPEVLNRDSEINTYIKDLYRFFKLFSRRNEFYQIFNSHFSVPETPLINRWVDDKTTMAAIAEFYFKNEFYQDAIEYFNFVLTHTAEPDTRYYQKIGFAWQCLGEYDKAITAYEKYELVRDDDIWNIRQIAACYRALNRYNQAIEQYNRALGIDTQNIPVLLNYAKTLLDSGNPAEALKVYFKVDFLDEKKHRAWRPIAWCSMILGNFNQSENYYRKIIDSESPTANDYLNYGHLSLLIGNIAQAVKMYRQSFKLFNNKEKFLSSINEDSQLLLDNGITPSTIALTAQAATRR